MGHLDDDIMNSVNDAISISFGLGDGGYREHEEHGDEYGGSYGTAPYPAAAAATGAQAPETPSAASAAESGGIVTA